MTMMIPVRSLRKTSHELPQNAADTSSQQVSADPWSSKLVQRYLALLCSVGIVGFGGLACPS